MVFTNRPSQLVSTTLHPGTCRHHSVLTEFSAHTQQIKSKPRTVLLHKKADLNAINADLAHYRDDLLGRDLSTCDTDTLWREFRDKFLATIDKHVPSKKINPRNTLPWITTHIRRLCRKRRRMYRKGGSRTEYKEFSKLVDNEIKKSYFLYLNDLFTPSEEQSGWDKHKAWYNFLKCKKRENDGVSPLEVNGHLITSDKEKAEALNKQFFSVYTQDDGSQIPNKGPSPHPVMPELYFSTAGIAKVLRELKVKKAAGPDGLSARYLKETADIIAPILQVIFNLSYTSGETPTDWKSAHICPIFKKGNRQCAANYRPVSLTSIASKVMEHCIVSNLLDHLETHHLLYKHQHGFRRKLSTETQLLTFVHELVEEVKSGRQVDAVVLDFSKAFDKVSHCRLLHKLHYYGIQGKTNRWIQAFLSDRKQAVLINGEKSEQLPVISGVPQGTVLGPALFLLYINDLPESVSSRVRLFADDAILYRTVNSQDDSFALQRDLEGLEEWERSWRMDFNPSKCSVISFTRSRSPDTYSYDLHGERLQRVSSAKYLGVMLSSNLSWTEHVNDVVSKANRALGMVRRNLKVAPREVKAQAYTSLVRPHLEYCSTVWDPHTAQDTQRLEAVQRRAARFTCRQYQYTSSPSEMMTRLGWTSLAERREQARLIMLFKMYHMLVNINIAHLLIPISRYTRHTHPLTFTRLSSSQNYYNRSFFPRTIINWNDLPANVVEAPSVEAFTSRLRLAPPTSP